jgi:hypothetical protein
MKTYGEAAVNFHLNLDNIWRTVVSFTLRLFNLRERGPCNKWIRIRLSLTSDVDAVEKRKILGSNPGRPAPIH